MTPHQNHVLSKAVSWFSNGFVIAPLLLLAISLFAFVFKKDGPPEDPIQKATVEGHNYLLIKGGKSMIHSESCPCKQKVEQP